ncbi:MAG: hypothetical protein KAV87_16520 [Desulfobacteraceae bacterium]|nr:hypothetical protein [Desulfobacteraceae bacterium]
METLETSIFLKDFIVQTVDYCTEKIKRNETLAAEQENMTEKILSEMEQSVMLGDKSGLMLAKQKMEIFYAALIDQQTIFLIKLVEITEAYELSFSCAQEIFKDNFKSPNNSVESLYSFEEMGVDIRKNLDVFSLLIINFDKSITRLSALIRKIKKGLCGNRLRNKDEFRGTEPCVFQEGYC